MRKRVWLFGLIPVLAGIFCMTYALSCDDGFAVVWLTLGLLLIICGLACCNLLWVLISRRERVTKAGACYSIICHAALLLAAVLNGLLALRPGSVFYFTIAALMLVYACFAGAWDMRKTGYIQIISKIITLSTAFLQGLMLSAVFSGIF